MNKKMIKDMVSLAGSFKGVSFASILYRNAKGELARYLINIGVSYRRILDRDLAKLLELRDDVLYVAELTTKYGAAVVKEAFAEMIASVEKSIAGENERANAQIDAYVHLNNGAKLGIESRDLYLYGYLVSKTVLEKGEYKAVKSRPKTLCKNEINKNLKGRKYRQFKFDSTNEFSTSGNRLIVEAA